MTGHTYAQMIARSSHTTRLFWIAQLVLIVGCLLRAFGMAGDLWLDEIWSLQVAQTMSSPLDLFHTSILDGHFSLYTLYLNAVGQGYEAYIYRLPSFLAGCLSLLLVYRIGRTRNTLTGFLALLLFACSFVFVLYGSEARGYSLMTFFVLLCHTYLLRVCRSFRDDAAPSASPLAFFFFNLSALLGFFSHPLFVQYLAASLLWFLFSFRKNAPFRLIRNTVALYLVPLLAIGTIYFFHLQYLAGGTGMIAPYVQIAINTLNLTFGFPNLSATAIEPSAFLFLFATLLFVFLLYRIGVLFRHQNGDWVLYFSVLLLIPLLFVLLLEPRSLSERYFLIAILFFTFLLAGWLSDLFCGSKSAKVIASVILFVFLIGNLVALERFFSYHRGSYSQALVDIELSTPSIGEITVSGDHPFRDKMLVEYFASKLHLSRVKYVEKAELADTPQWWIEHSQDWGYEPTAMINKEQYGSYLLYKIYPFGALSGWSWYLYQHAPS